MLSWLERHSKALQAAAGILTVLLALAALLGVKYQVDASARLQREQSARDIYRELLNISISNPDLAAPNHCALKSTPKYPAYESYVEYLLYTAEQVMDMDPSWGPTFTERLKDHSAYICAIDDWSGYSDAVEAMVNEFRSKNCAAVSPACP